MFGFFSKKLVIYNSVFFKRFINNERTGGIILLSGTIISLLLANSSIGAGYHHIWQYQICSNTIEYWINDGLMAIFFLLVGLELKRELLTGELSRLKVAIVPFIGAIGGMLVPALIYVYFNYGQPSVNGFGIPMATDIGFAVGVIALLGKRVPMALRVLLVALAIIDDLGAIVILVFFYTSNISYSNLGIVTACIIILFTFRFLQVKNILAYILVGIIMWYYMLNSGLHATLSGIFLAIILPYSKGNKKSLSDKVERFLHKPVAFFILPLFAIVNTSIIIYINDFNLFSYINLGILMGLVVGKPIGIFLFIYLGKLFKICALPEGISWLNILGMGILGGIGFTMSIFFALLSFKHTNVINDAKITILLSSILAAIIGLFFLLISTKVNKLHKSSVRSNEI